MAPAHSGRFQPTVVTEEPLNAFLRTTADCLIVLEAFERHMIPRIHRRLREPERRRFIRSGAVFVFDEKESEIKRWTDGFSWSPSRILGNFLVYREISPMSRRSGSSSDSESSPDDNTSERSALDKEVYGSLKSHQSFKPGGLMKRTISVVIKERTIHVVCYYNPEDVMAGRLMTPTEMPHLRGLLSVVHPELLQKTLYRFPPLVQLGPDGVERYAGEAEGGGSNDVSSGLPGAGQFVVTPMLTPPYQSALTLPTLLSHSQPHSQPHPHASSSHYHPHHPNTTWTPPPHPPPQALEHSGAPIHCHAPQPVPPPAPYRPAPTKRFHPYGRPPTSPAVSASAPSSANTSPRERRSSHSVSPTAPLEPLPPIDMPYQNGHYSTSQPAEHSVYPGLQPNVHVPIYAPVPGGMRWGQEPAVYDYSHVPHV